MPLPAPSSPRARGTEGAAADALREDLRKALEKAVRAVLRRLYPGTGGF